MEIWFLGTALDDGRWMAEGAFLTEAEAVSHANVDEFIVLTDMGRFPTDVNDAKKLYWPKHETWEESSLYQTRYINKGNEYE